VTATSTGAGDRCQADPDRIRDWLTARHDFEAPPVATDLGIDEFFNVDDIDRNVHLSRLFEAAQDAGVFGLPGYTVELWHVTDGDGVSDGHLLIARREDDMGFASGHVPTDHLIDSDLEGVDAAVSALTNGAVIVDDALGAHHALAADHGRPVAARAFPPPQVAPAAGPTVPPVAAVSAPAAHRAHR
jgi:hypothetical protein